METNGTDSINCEEISNSENNIILSPSPLPLSLSPSLPLLSPSLPLLSPSLLSPLSSLPSPSQYIQGDLDLQIILFPTRTLCHHRTIHHDRSAAALGGDMRMMVLLVVIMFELTGGLSYIVYTVLISKWVGNLGNPQPIYLSAERPLWVLYN